MKNLNSHVSKANVLRAALLLSALGSPAAMAQEAAAPAPAPMSTPAMAGPLAANPNPLGFDFEDMGKIYVGGAVSGMAYFQSNPTKLTPGDVSSYMDLTNAQVTVQKTDGWLQFYVQAGEYSFPTVGVTYAKSSLVPPATFGVVPVAYLKLQGQGDFSDWSIEGGKLPTVIGDEYNFTFENMNIERGLLWNTEPAISRGVQVNFSSGPFSASLSVNDGYYSNVLNTLSGVVSYAVDPTDTVAFSGSGNLGSPKIFAVHPFPYNSPFNLGSVYNLIWTHTDGAWVISPYFQYQTTPTYSTPALGTLLKSTELSAAAVLASYSFDDNWKLAGRFEIENTTGRSFAATPNVLGFGAGSNAYEFTITPTWEYKLLFARAELSYVSVGNGTSGSLFNAPTYNSNNQVRVLLETGVVF
jgi:hypothetical protein